MDNWGISVQWIVAHLVAYSLFLEVHDLRTTLCLLPHSVLRVSLSIQKRTFYLTFFSLTALRVDTILKSVFQVYAPLISSFVKNQTKSWCQHNVQSTVTLGMLGGVWYSRRKPLEHVGGNYTSNHS